MLECVINLSEGRDRDLLGLLGRQAGADLLDLHADPHHHRAVLTTVGEVAARAVATTAISRLDLRRHDGVHPRLGIVDVVPFVGLAPSTLGDALAARDAFAAWLASTHGVPCFLYGPERTLPEVRRRAFRDLPPDVGPSEPHPSAGATAVGARPALIAYNVWLDGADLAATRRIAADVRRPSIRALGLRVGSRLQVSMNLIEPLEVGPAAAYDLVAALAAARGATAVGAELVGLVPDVVLRAIDPARWAGLDLSPDRTIDARLASRSG